MCPYVFGANRRVTAKRITHASLFFSALSLSLSFLLSLIFIPISFTLVFFLSLSFSLFYPRPVFLSRTRRTLESQYVVCRPSLNTVNHTHTHTNTHIGMCVWMPTVHASKISEYRKKNYRTPRITVLLLPVGTRTSIGFASKMGDGTPVK